MFDNRGLPDYPPPHNTWRFPPPPISTRWKWVALAAAVFGLVCGTTLLVIVISVGSSGLPTTIDDTALVNVIERECRQMTSEVESMPIEGPPEAQASTITDQNQAIERMVRAIRAVGSEVLAGDPPTEEWLADWHSLVRAREKYVRQILAGATPSLDIPDDDRGMDIYIRMDDAFFDASSCEVPDVLLNPYPDYSSRI